MRKRARIPYNVRIGNYRRALEACEYFINNGKAKTVGITEDWLINRYAAIYKDLLRYQLRYFNRG